MREFIGNIALDIYLWSFNINKELWIKRYINAPIWSAILRPYLECLPVPNADKKPSLSKERKDKFIHAISTLLDLYIDIESESK
jgi:hypothetical protein